MTENKPIMIDGIDVSGCEDYGYRGSAGYWCHNYDEPCTDYPNCYFKQLSRKTQECEELRHYHNKCCQEFENEKKELLDKYNQLSRDFYNGEYCKLDNCKQLQIKEQECEALKKQERTKNENLETKTI